MKNKEDIYLQGFICLLQILNVVAIKLQILTEIFQSWSQVPSLQVKCQNTAQGAMRAHEGYVTDDVFTAPSGSLLF